MNRIFISHKQNFKPAQAIKKIIDMLGVEGVLVEELPGAGSPTEKSFQTLLGCQGFLAICTKDTKDDKDIWHPRPNVVLEIQDWQKHHKGERLIIMKEKGCQLPELLGHPTYCEFEGETILEAVCRTLSDFQQMGVISRFEDAKNTVAANDNLNFGLKDLDALTFLAGSPDREAPVGALQQKFEYQGTEWNIFLHKWQKQPALIEHKKKAHQFGTESVRLTNTGFELLLKKGLIK